MSRLASGWSEVERSTSRSLSTDYHVARPRERPGSLVFEATSDEASVGGKACSVVADAAARFTLASKGVTASVRRSFSFLILTSASGQFVQV